ncbi:hypothetical protein [Streptomyces sp. SP18ES09]|nr:hypothetical protein [Streptomyces sp. SP18ES09]
MFSIAALGAGPTASRQPARHNHATTPNQAAKNNNNPKPSHGHNKN